MSSRGERGDDDDPRERIDRSENSGGVGHGGGEWDVNAPDDDRGYTKTRTKFYASEGDNSWELRRRQRRHDSKQAVSRTEERDAHRREDVEKYASRFELTNYQKNRTLKLFQKLETKQFGRYRIETVLLGLMGAVCAEDGRDLTHETAFEEMVAAESDGATPIDARRVWTLLAERLESLEPYNPTLWE